MSRKTEEIKKSISRLGELQKRLSTVVCSEASKEIALISEQMKSELENLRLWIDMLYKYNGTSKSRAKVAASRENGKKGGRPPKFVTDLKKQKYELELLLKNLHDEEVIASAEDNLRIEEEKQLAMQKLSDVDKKLQNIVNA